METDGGDGIAAVAAATSPAGGDAEGGGMDEDGVGGGSDKGEQEMDDAAENLGSFQQPVADGVRTATEDALAAADDISPVKAGGSYEQHDMYDAYGDGESEDDDENDEPYCDAEDSVDLVEPPQAAEAAGEEPTASVGTGVAAGSSPLAGDAEPYRWNLPAAGAEVYDSQDPERLPQPCGGPAHRGAGAGGGAAATADEGCGTDREEEEGAGVGVGKPRGGSKVARATAWKRRRARKPDRRGAAAAGGGASEELEDGAGAGAAGAAVDVVRWAQTLPPSPPPYPPPEVSPYRMLPMPQQRQQAAGCHSTWGGSSNSAGEGVTVGTALPGSDCEDGADQVVLDSQGAQGHQGGSQGEGEEEREWGPVETGQYDDAGDLGSPNRSEGKAGAGGTSGGQWGAGDGRHAEGRPHHRWDDYGQPHVTMEPIEVALHARSPRCQPQHGQRPERLLQHHSLQQQQQSQYPPSALNGQLHPAHPLRPGGSDGVHPHRFCQQQPSRSLLQVRD